MRRRTLKSLSSLFVLSSALILATQASAFLGDCGQPVTRGVDPTATDCLFILKVSVNIETYAPPCVLDTNSNGDVTATDALVCLSSVVGGPLLAECPCPIPPDGHPINESCTVCHGQGRVFDVAAMHPGLQAIPDVQASIDSVSVAVDDVAKTARMTVNFTVTDPDGNYIENLGSNVSRPDRFDYLRFALSELVPPGTLTGDPDTWMAYTIGDRTPANLTDHGDGTYTYVLATNLYTTYVPSYRHRLLLTISGAIFEQSKNVTYDFVPDQLPGPFSFDTSRDIITTSACNECHGRLGSTLGDGSFHGGSRYTAESCTTCHTVTLGGGAAELTPMIHKIHTSQDLGELGDFSEVTYPQDIRNCAKCHAGPDGSNWNTRPSMTACGSCHTGIDFATGAGHAVGPQLNNANCALCHTPERITENHVTENATPNNPDVPEGLVSFEYVIEEVTVNELNQPVVTFHINKDGVPLNLATIPPAGFSGAPSFLVAYAMPQDGVQEPGDYTQLGLVAGQPASVSLTTLVGKLTGTPESYTAVLTTATFPAGSSLRAIALQGYFTQLKNPNDPEGEDVARHTPSVVMAVTGDTVRREIVDSNKCLDCHEIIEAHGGNRVNNVQVCVVCHNPNLSSSGRTVNTALTAQEEKDKLAAAGYDPNDALTWPERTQNMKNLVHGIHASGKREFDFEFVRNRLNGLYYNWSEVTYPGILSDCETCHLPGTYRANQAAGLLVSTEVTTDGLNMTTADVSKARASVPNPTDLVNSQISGSCFLCHDNAPAAAHMDQNGGVLAGWRAEALGD
ncbi:MAG: OmcA/MtrC family decaheme c-type cytochrome [Candidatus Binatia bacterium]